MPLPWLSEDDVAYYDSQFRTSGFRGPLNRYRNHARDYAFLKTIRSIIKPSLMAEGLVLKMFRGRRCA
ncbi:MAG: hypothetical protein R3C08_02670 [Hyphomonas sp.]